MKKLLYKFACYLMYVYWETTLNKELKELWDNGKEPEKILMPMAFKKPLEEYTKNIKTVDVYESEFGYIPIKFFSFVKPKKK